MRKPRRRLPIILPAMTILGIMAVSGHAKKPTPSAPIIQVVGGIKILPDGTTSDPSYVRVRFLDSSFNEDPLTAPWAGLSFPANADRSPALYTIIMRAGPPDTLDRWLRFYFCAHPSHQEGTGTDDLRCQDPEGHSAYYYCLNLQDGQTTAKGRGDLNHLTFPAGTLWSVGWKAAADPSVAVTSGHLVTETTYDVIR